MKTYLRPLGLLFAGAAIMLAFQPTPATYILELLSTGYSAITMKSTDNAVTGSVVGDIQSRRKNSAGTDTLFARTHTEVISPTSTLTSSRTLFSTQEAGGAVQPLVLSGSVVGHKILIRTDAMPASGPADAMLQNGQCSAPWLDQRAVYSGTASTEMFITCKFSNGGMWDYKLCPGQGCAVNPR